MNRTISHKPVSHGAREIYLFTTSNTDTMPCPVAVCLTLSAVDVDRLKEVAHLCKKHGLHAAEIALGNARWISDEGKECDLVGGDIAKVTPEGGFWIETSFEEVDGLCGTDVMSIATLAEGSANGIRYLGRDPKHDDALLEARIAEAGHLVMARA